MAGVAGTSEDPETQRLISHLSDMEEKAEKIISSKHDLVELDRMRNNNRVALRQLKKANESKTWIAMGNTLFRLKSDDAKQFLEEEQAKVEKSMEDIRKEMKTHMEKLRDLEGKPPLKGFDLKPLAQDELAAVYETYKK